MQPYLSSTLLLQSLAACVTAASSIYLHADDTTLAKHLVYQYHPITWVENLAVRPNGWILPTTTTSPVLNQLDPATGELKLVHDFSAYGNAIQGITEVVPDVFAVDVLTCNITQLTCTQGSVSTWQVSFGDQKHPHNHHHDDVSVREVTTFPRAGFLNGLAALNQDIVLIADSYLGGVWSLDLRSRQKRLLFTDTAMNGTASIATGINGIRVRPGLLYFTNSAKGTFNRIPINPRNGEKSGKAEAIESGLSGPDDFEIDDASGVAYVCNGAANEVLRIPLSGGKAKVVANIPGPTSVRWSSPTERKFYISDVGGLLQYIQQNVTVGGAIYSITI